MAHKLFILVSEDLREQLLLGDDIINVLVLPEGRMTAEKEPSDEDVQELWERELKPLILARVRDNSDWKESTVRFAGHFRPCFGDMAHMGRNDQRFPQIEQGLVDALGQAIDIQIWGFHHENWSEIWKVASQVKTFLGDPGKEIQFLLDLEQAFLKAATQNEKISPSLEQNRIEERFAIARHEIMGLFVPLQMRLENARDMKEDSPSEAHEIEASVNDSIGPLVKKAVRLWKKCAPMVPEGGPKKSFDAVVTQLEKQPNPNSVEFRAWLDTLYDCLSKF